MVYNLTKIKIVYYKISQMVVTFPNKFQILIIIVSDSKFINIVSFAEKMF